MSIRALREAAGMRQYELAARMGVKQASVSAWRAARVIQAWRT